MPAVGKHGDPVKQQEWVFMLLAIPVVHFTMSNYKTLSFRYICFASLRPLPRQLPLPCPALPFCFGLIKFSLV